MAASDDTCFLVYVGSSKKERYAKISPQDAELVLRYRWSISSVRKGNSRINYVRTHIGPHSKRVQIKMHRLIMDAPEGMHVDHINGDGLDNRRENLRIVTPQLNQANSRKHIAGTSKFKGVSWFKPVEKWRAYICVNRRQKHIGLFDDEIEAAKAYDAVALATWGENAHLNLA